MELCYEEYSDDKKRRYRIYKENEFFKVILQQYHEEYDCMGYIEPAGFMKYRQDGTSCRNYR